MVSDKTKVTRKTMVLVTSRDMDYVVKHRYCVYYDREKNIDLFGVYKDKNQVVMCEIV